MAPHPKRPSWSSSVGALAAGALVAYLAVWIFFVNTRIGQQIDDRAFLARGILPKSVVRAIDDFLAFSTPLFAALFCVILLLLGWRTHRIRLGITMAISLGITEIAGEILKYFEVRRNLDPKFYEELGNKMFNSFPSGTTALAAGFVLGLIALATNRSRRISFRVGLFLVQLVAVFVVLAGWHRPSDALGGIALAVFFAAIGLWLGNSQKDHDSLTVAPEIVRVPWKSAVILGAVIVIATFILGSLDSLPDEIGLFSLILFMLVIPLFAALTITRFTRLAGLGSSSVKQNA